MSINNIPAARAADQRWLPLSLFITARPEEDLAQSFFSKRSKSTQSKPGLFNTVVAINNISPSTFVNVTLLPLLSYTRGICLVSSPVGTFTRFRPAEYSQVSTAKWRNFIWLRLCYLARLFHKQTEASFSIRLLMTFALMFRSYVQTVLTFHSLACD